MREKSGLVIVSLLASLLLAPASAVALGCTSDLFQSGAGTSDSPFQIADEVQLKNLTSCVETSSGNTFDDLVFELAADITVTSTASLPIGGSGSKVFQSELRGAGKSIILPTGMNFPSQDFGLFYRLYGARISELTISGTVSTDRNAGLLAYSAENASVNRVTAMASVSASRSAGALFSSAFYTTLSNIILAPHSGISTSDPHIIGGAKTFPVGGLVGQATELAIFNVSSSLNVQAPADYVGGLVGDLNGGSNGKTSIVRSNSSGFVKQTEISGTPTTAYVGGLVGRLDGNSSAVLVKDSFASGNVEGYVSGGLIGGARNVRIERSFSIGDVSAKYALSNNARSGGLVGQIYSGTATETFVRESYASGNVGTTLTASGVRLRAGGLIGHVDYEIVSIENVIALGTVSTGTINETSSGIGGLIGDFSPPAGSSSISNALVVGSSINNGTATAYPFIGRTVATGTASGNFFLTSNLSADDSYGSATWASAILQSSVSEIATFEDVGYEISLLPGQTIPDSKWIMCSDRPYLSWTKLPQTCPLFPVYVEVAESGTQITLEFNGDLTQLPDISTLGLSPTRAISSIATTSANVLVVTLASPIGMGAEVTITYVKPTSGSILQRQTSVQAAESFSVLADLNRSLVPGPSPNFVASVTSPSSFTGALTCGGACGSGDAYAYTVSLSLNGQTVETRVGTATQASELFPFMGLLGNSTYLVTTTVAFGGAESSTTVSVTTPKPAATISAISVLDTSATLTVGCTNCGASPDSFTVSATPVAGGAPITSNTNVISGLSPETTYSFSVVVAFAGTTSDVVLWQDNPVMTLPLVPVITAVSPAAVPLTGGTITVTGANFTTSTLLTLGITSSAFTIVSGTEITFTAPSGTSGSFALAITNPVGTFTLPGAITYVSGPSLTTNSPVLATTNGGTIVTLTGTDLATTNQVNVGSTTVSFSVVSNTVVRFTTAATTAGVVDVGVVTVGGAATISSAIEFTTSALVPVISTITPVTGPTAGGTTITVIGQHFSGSYSNSVSAAINGISGSSVILIDDSTLTFVSPQGAAATGLDVTVATGGGVGTLAGAFTYTAPPVPTIPGSAPAVVINTPTITEFSTREIPASGASVTATGLRLENVSVLTLGGIAVTIVSNTATSLTFTTGEMPIGVWDLRLVGSNGTLVFQQAIEVVEATAIVAESTGQLLGYTWTLKFLGNSRSLHDAQAAHLSRRLNPDAQTIICWGYTTAANPKAWAIAHATQRAQAACDFASANQGNVKTVVRLRYGVSKDYAMRSALQFWELKPAP